MFRTQYNSIEVLTIVAIVPDEAANNAFYRLLDFLGAERKGRHGRRTHMPHAHEVMEKLVKACNCAGE